MLKDIKNTSKHTIIYALGNIGVKLIGLVLIPVYTDPKFLSQANYGVLAVLEATLQLLIGVLTMAMTTSLSRWYWDKNYINKQKSIFFSSYVFLLVTIIPVILIISYSSVSLSKLLFSSIEYSYLLKLTFIAAGIQVLNNQALTLAKIQSKSIMYSFVTILKFALSLSLIIWGVVYRRMGLEAIWQATVVAEGFIFLILLLFVVKNSSFSFHWNILKEMMNYGYPLMLASVSAVILAVTDRYMLSSMSGLVETGIYSLGFRISSTLKVVISTSIIYAITPLRMKKIDDPKNQRFYSKIATYSSFIFIIGLIIISLFSLEFLKLFTGSKDYWAADGIVPVLSYAFLFGLIKDNTIIGLTITKRTKIIGLLIFATSMLNIALNYSLIPIFDIYGAAIATVLSQLVFLSLVTRFAQKSYYIPYEWGKIALLILASMIVVFIGWLIKDLSGWLRIPIKISVLIAFPFVLYSFKFYEQREIEIIKSMLQTWSNLRVFKSNLRRLLKS